MLNQNSIQTLIRVVGLLEDIEGQNDVVEMILDAISAPKDRAIGLLLDAKGTLAGRFPIIRGYVDHSRRGMCTEFSQNWLGDIIWQLKSEKRRSALLLNPAFN